MPRRYQYYPRRRRSRDTESRRRSPLMRPSVQLAIVAIAVLVIYLILQSAGK